MTQDINNNEIKEVNFIEIILSSWKYKKNFIYILIPLILLAFILDYLVPKKSKFQLFLKDPTSINIDIYPLEYTIASEYILNLATLDMKQINMQDEKISLNYYYGYFVTQVTSLKNLIEFAKINNEKYNIQNYIVDNSISVKQEKISVFSIILPENKINENFLFEYIKFTTEHTLESYRKDILKIQRNKLDVLNKDIEQIRKIVEMENENFNLNNLLIQNVNTILALYEAAMIRIEDNVLYFEDLEKGFNENWIVDGPIKTVINEKFYKIMKFILPIILSLIIYLLYLVIKLTRLDRQN